MNNNVEEIRSLIEYLNGHTKLYDEGRPTISDKEWDDKYFKLKKLEDECLIYFNNSPTQSVSYQVINALEKVEHNHDMLSLEKTKSLDEVKNFLGHHPYLAMCKMDGLTCSLTYIDGELAAAETRGNGKVGENILHNARVIPSIPKRIPYIGKLVVDGEIICSKFDFEEFAEDYANPRNFAAGSIRLLDSKECSKRRLQFVAWDMIEGLDNFDLLSNKLIYLRDCGFTVVPYCGYDDYERDVEEITQMAEKYGYPIDGLVFKFDNIEYGKSLGKTSHHFKNALAYKFYDETYSSFLTDIDWTMGRTGVLTPVAIFEPIDMDGSTVSRASLHNLSIMEEILGEPYYGQKVEVSKRNMIIPQIESAEKVCNTGYRHINNPYLMPTPQNLIIPEVCPICGNKTEIRMDIDTKVLYCSNPSCPGKLINHLDHAIGKNGLDIKGLSKATLEKLIEWEWVEKYSDIFNLKNHRAEWIRKPGFGIRSVDKVLDSIESSRECELSAFITSLGIPLIGSTASKELAKVFSTWENFINAVESGYHFWDIPNFGFEMHSAITKFDYTEAKELYSNYLSVRAAAVPIGETADSLANVNVVITGKLTHFKNRDELKDAIERRGGKVVGSISSKTNYLINNDINSTSSKNTSAKKLGIPIVSEDMFNEMFSIF